MEFIEFKYKYIYYILFTLDIERKREISDVLCFDLGRKILFFFPFYFPLKFNESDF